MCILEMHAVEVYEITGLVHVYLCKRVSHCNLRLSNIHDHPLMVYTMGTIHKRAHVKLQHTQ